MELLRVDTLSEVYIEENYKNQSSAGSKVKIFTVCRILKLLFEVIAYIANAAKLLACKFLHLHNTTPCCKSHYFV